MSFTMPHFSVWFVSSFVLSTNYREGWWEQLCFMLRRTKLNIVLKSPPTHSLTKFRVLRGWQRAVYSSLVVSVCYDFSDIWNLTRSCTPDAPLLWPRKTKSTRSFPFAWSFLLDRRVGWVFRYLRLVSSYLVSLTRWFWGLWFLRSGFTCFNFSQLLGLVWVEVWRYLQFQSCSNSCCMTRLAISPEPLKLRTLLAN